MILETLVFKAFQECDRLFDEKSVKKNENTLKLLLTNGQLCLKISIVPREKCLEQEACEHQYCLCGGYSSVG